MREACKKQIKRLATTVNFPDPKQFPESLTELVDTLERIAGSEKEAEAIISECLAISKFCPTPHDLQTVASDLRDKLRPSWKPDYGNAFVTCRKCGDNGIVHDGRRWIKCDACRNGLEYPDALLELANTPQRLRPGMQHVGGIVNIDALRVRRSQ